MKISLSNVNECSCNRQPHLRSCDIFKACAPAVFHQNCQHCGAELSMKDNVCVVCNRAAFEGRPISLEFHSTPKLWCAFFRDEYDGAPDSHSPTGFGKTEKEAIADLIENDQDGYAASYGR